MLKIFYSALPEKFSNYSLDSIRLFFQESLNSIIERETCDDPIKI